MSVYKPAKTPFYQYDFQLKNRRFHGSTGLTNKKLAEAFEEKRRVEAEEEISGTARLGNEPMTIDVAAGRYWLEVGKHHVCKNDTKRALRFIVTEIGPHVRIGDISDGTVAELVAKRRAAVTQGKKPRPVSPATVNRTCTEPLRKVLNRAREVWGQTVQPIRWGRHLLSEPRERVRELSANEEEKLLAAIRPDFQPIFHFALWTGLRMSEALRLTWKDIDWGNRLIRVSGKGGKVSTIPLEPDVRDLLFPLQGRHETAIFCYQTARGASAWKPITYNGLKTRWARDRAQSGVADYRWHDNRHTAATRLLRASGNVKIVQKLLRHSDISTTTKYAHVSDDDVRIALEAAAERRRIVSIPQEPDKAQGDA